MITETTTTTANAGTARKQRKMDQAIDALLLLRRLGLGHGTDVPAIGLTMIAAVATKVGPHSISRRNLLNHLNALCETEPPRLRCHRDSGSAASSWEVLEEEAYFAEDVSLPAWQP